MNDSCAILDYSPYGNAFDPRSDALLASALTAEQRKVDILPLSRETVLHVDAGTIWLRYDIRSRKDLLLIMELGRLLESRHKRVFPSPKAVWAAEDKWETFLALQKNGIPTLPTFRSRDYALCSFPAMFKTRTGWGGLGNQLIPRPEDLAVHDVPTSATLLDGTPVAGVMRRSPLKSDGYLCQPFIPHVRTLVLALAGQIPICCLEDRGQNAFEEGRGPVVPLTEEALKLSQAALKAVGLVAGTIDLIETPEGLRVLEVNSAPRLTYPHLPDVDLAGPMVKAVLDWFAKA